METKVEGKIQRSKSDVLKRLLRDDRTSPILLLVLAVLFLCIVTQRVEGVQYPDLRTVDTPPAPVQWGISLSGIDKPYRR